jgi:hypothetical protein
MIKNKNINYLNRDFNSLKEQLINYAQTYFPNTYNDFSLSSPGTMFIDMASYVGDVLSFYLDNQIQETFLQFARKESNLYNLAYMMGYKPKVISPSIANLTFYQLVPSITSGSVVVPDFSYTLKVDGGAVFQANLANTVNFILQDDVDFSYSSSLDPTKVEVYSVVSNRPQTYLLSKTKQVTSAVINTTSFQVGTPQSFLTLEINGENIIRILDIVDSQGNTWYEVDSLAQDTIYSTIKNINSNDPNFSSNQNDTPYLLQLEKVSRRFVTRFKNSTTLQIQFGAGTVADVDERIIPNPNNIGIGLPYIQSRLNTAFSPTNFMLDRSYGISPSNITLTVRYLTGGGVLSNVQSNTINIFAQGSLRFNNSSLNSNKAQAIFNSFAVDNLEAASGGGDGDSLEDIRLNSIAQFNSQLRTVTQDDYTIRALSMPPQYGQVGKVLVTPQKASEVNIINNTNSIDLYVLGYNNEKKLTIPSLAFKNNLKTYLSQYRMINDSINIKNGFIINISIDFDIIVLPNVYNSNEVLIACNLALQDYFNIDKWQFNQPIILGDLYILLNQIQGVQNIKNIKIINKVGENLGYSKYAYDIDGATLNNVIYPSIDPSIFEIKFPDSDIRGRVVSF